MAHLKKVFYESSSKVSRLLIAPEENLPMRHCTAVLRFLAQTLLNIPWAWPLNRRGPGF